MKEVKSKKPFLEAIQNGEQQIKVTDPKFLMVCLVYQGDGESDTFYAIL